MEGDSWLDEYGGVPEGSNMLTWIDEIDLPDITALLRCRGCGHSTAGDGSVEELCWVGNCSELRCAKCDTHWGGWGPVGCPCQRRHPRIRRIRQMYRARHR